MNAHRNPFDSTYGIMLLVLFPFNALLSTVLLSVGLTSGFEGKFAWNWEEYSNTLIGLFGSFGTLLALIGGLVLIVGACVLAGFLAHRQNVTGAVIWFLVGAIVGGFILFKLVEWDDVTIGFAPVFFLIVFTAIEGLMVRLVARRLQPVQH